tara:strand:+ start:63 stop:872 length:810 start_codon:yes stop_codon:yes gene_type:complete
MAVSPPGSPQPPASSPPTGATGCFSRLHIDDISLGNAVTVPSNHEPEPLCSAIHTWGLSDEELHAVSYIFFEEATEDVIAWGCSSGRPRASKGAVLPQSVFADSLSWTPLVSDTGDRGWGFSLKLEGEPQATIEVLNSRIVVVHNSFSPLSVEAKLVSPSTRLVFEASHLQELTQVVSKVLDDEEIGYLPTGEILLGRGVDRLMLRRRRGGDVEHDEEAQRVWNMTKARLRSMNSVVVSGIDAQNSRELASAGVGPREVSLPSLRTFFK